MMNSSDPIQSPCRARCKLDEQKICLGCFRSETEIVGWGRASDEQKRAINKRAQQRKNA